jgi:hypothetical protein
VFNIRDPKGFTGEIKRILMLLHLARETGCSTDVVYHKDFKRIHTQIHTGIDTFKLLLGTKHNQIEIKKDNRTKQYHRQLRNQRLFAKSS